MKNPFKRAKQISEESNHTIISKGEKYLIYNRTLGFYFSKWAEGPTVIWTDLYSHAREYYEGEGGELDVDRDRIISTRKELHEEIEAFRR